MHVALCLSANRLPACLPASSHLAGRDAAWLTPNRPLVQVVRPSANGSAASRKATGGAGPGKAAGKPKDAKEAAKLEQLARESQVHGLPRPRLPVHLPNRQLLCWAGRPLPGHGARA